MNYSTAIRVYNAALNAGASPVLAYTLTTMAYKESGFNPTLVGDHGASQGLFQWDSGSYSRTSDKSLEAQIAKEVALVNKFAADANTASSPEDAFAAIQSTGTGKIGLGTPGAFYTALSDLQNAGFNPLDQQGAQQPVSLTDWANQFLSPGQSPDYLFGAGTAGGPFNPAPWQDNQPTPVDTFAPHNPDPGGDQFPSPVDTFWQNPAPANDLPSPVDTYGPVAYNNPAPWENNLPSPVDTYGTGSVYGAGSAGVGNQQFDYGTPFYLSPGSNSSFVDSLFSPQSSADYLFGTGQRTTDFGQPGVPDYLAPPDPNQGDTQSFIDSLFAPQPNSDYMFGAGGPGTTEALTDWNSANQQFGEGNWYYDSNGNVVGSSNPFGGSVAGGSPGNQQSQSPDFNAWANEVTALLNANRSSTTPAGFAPSYTPFGGGGSGSGAVGGVGPQYSGGGGTPMGGFSLGGASGSHLNGLNSSIGGMISAALTSVMPFISSPLADPFSKKSGGDP